MRVLAFCLMAATAAATSFAALGAPLYPQGAVALESQLIAAQSADAKAWIKDEAGREATLHNVNEETPRNAARKFGATGSDVSKLAFLVLMEASRTADANVANLVNGVQGASASRQDIRQAQMNDNVIAGAQQGQRSGGEQTAEQAQGQAFLSLLPENSDDNPIAQAKRAQAVPAPTMTLQDAMDRQNQIEDLLKVAMTNVTQPT